jgi:hypothetical protein
MNLFFLKLFCDDFSSASYKAIEETTSRLALLGYSIEKDFQYCRFL